MQTSITSARPQDYGDSVRLSIPRNLIYIKKATPQSDNPVLRVDRGYQSAHCPEQNSNELIIEINVIHHQC